MTGNSALLAIRALFRTATSLAERSPRWATPPARFCHRLVLALDVPSLSAEASFLLGTLLSLREEPAALTILSQAETLFNGLQNELDAARCRWQRGVALRLQGQWQAAADLLEQALSEFERLEAHADAARARRELALAIGPLDRIDQAQVLIGAAQQFFVAVGQSLEIAHCEQIAAMMLRQRTRYREALELAQRAERTFRAAHRPTDAARALYTMGLIYEGLLAPEQALRCFRQALRLYRSLALPKRIAYCHWAQGNALWRMGQPAAARAHLEKALNWFAAHDMPEGTSECLLNLGNVAYVEGDYAEAARCYQQGRVYYEQAGVDSVVARCDQNLGLVHRQRGQVGAALDHYHRAANVLERNQVNVWAADCYCKMAEIYYGLRQGETALFYLQRAQESYVREDIRLSDAWCDILRARIAAGDGLHAAARQALDKARQTIESTGSLWHMGLCERLLGDLMVEQEEWVTAIDRYEAARRHFASAQAVTDEATCSVGLGRAYHRSGQIERAERELTAALRTVAGALPEWSWQADAELALIAQERGENQAALAHYRQATAALDAIRTALPEAELAGGLVASSKWVYQQGIRLALELGRLEQALEITEDSKTTVLEQAVRSIASPETTDPYVEKLLAQEGRLRADIARLRPQLLGSFDQRLDTAASDATALLSRLSELYGQHRRAIQQLQVGRGGPLSANRFALPRFRAAATARWGTNWTALVYYWLDPEWVIFTVDAQGVRTTVRSLGRLAQAALEMCTSPAPERRLLALEDNLHGAASPTAVGRRYRQFLYRQFIPDDVAADLSPERLLLLVPHGPLHALPFQALEDERGFLVEQATLGCAPSLGVLEGLLVRAQPAAPGRALLIGLTEFAQQKPSLRWTRKEVETLQAEYGTAARCLLDAEASSEAVKTWSETGELASYSLLHWASHATLDVTSGALSGLALWDADLTPVEIARLRLGPAVVVLSACQSGLGTVQPGDEMVSLPYAFFSAGAQTVLVSLWHVEDESTMQLMVDLHRSLREGMMPAAALAQVQRQAIRGGMGPYQWAAFTSQGIP